MSQKAVMPALLIALAGAVLAGCASTNQSAPVAAGPIAPDRARIVVFRPSQVKGGPAPIAITDNGTRIGEIGPAGTLAWYRPAGAMELIATNGFATPGAGQGAPLRIGVSGSETYQIRVAFPFAGFAPTAELVSGTSTASQPAEARTRTGQPQSPQGLPAAPGDTQTAVGTVTAYLTGFRFESGPPLWPAGLLRVATERGEIDYLVVGKGPQATIF
jgi:hypothetical protein